MTIKEVILAVCLAILMISCGKENVPMKKSAAIKTETFNLEVEKGHFIAEIGGKRVLVDTGSPSTGGSFTSEVFGSVDNGSTVTGIPLSSISRLAGVQFDALLGMDLLSNVNFSFRLKEKKMIVSTGEPEGEGTEIPLGFVMGVPKVPVSVNGKETTMLLDTGAFISYFSPAMVKGLNPVREQEDYYPLMGKFTTKVFELDLTIAGKKANMEGGILPGVLRMTLGMVSGNPAILGNKVFEHFDADFIMLRETKALRLDPVKAEAEPKAGFTVAETAAPAEKEV